MGDRKAGRMQAFPGQQQFLHVCVVVCVLAMDYSEWRVCGHVLGIRCAVCRSTSLDTLGAHITFIISDPSSICRVACEACSVAHTV